MTTTFRKNATVQVKQREFGSLIKALSETVENHLTYVEDEVTSAIWNDLVCNGIKKQDLVTITSVAHMLNMTDKNQMCLASVISTLFNAVPILTHYWSIEK